jgi:hypothetical protein
MGRIKRLGGSALAAALLAIGVLAPAAMAAGSTGVNTMRPFSDGGWTPSTGAVLSTRPFSDGGWTPSTGAVLSTRPFSDGSWAPDARGVLTMRPFSDPNAIPPGVAAEAETVASSSQPSGLSTGITVVLIAGALALVLAAGIGIRLRGARPA